MNTRVTNVGTEMTSVGSRVNLTVSSTAVSFSAGNFPSSYRYVMFQVKTNPVLLSYDGTDVPTASDGQRKVAGDEAIMLRATFLRLKFIRESSDAVIWALPCNLT